MSLPYSSFEFPNHSNVQFALDNGKPENDFSARHLVQQYDVDQTKLVIKFMAEERVNSNAKNAALFRFLDLPFVPCEVMRIAPRTYTKRYAALGYKVPHHAIIMPFCQERTLATYDAEKEPEVVQPFYQTIKKRLPEMLVSLCSDAQPRNVMATNSSDIVMIDPEHGLFTHKNPNILKAYEAMISNYQLFYPDHTTPVKQQIVTLQETLENASDLLQKKIQKDLPIEFANMPYLAETLLENARRLTQIKVSNCFLK